MSETLTQWLGFGGNIGTWVGTLVIAPIAERCFERCVLPRCEYFKSYDLAMSMHLDVSENVRATGGSSSASSCSLRLSLCFLVSIRRANRLGHTQRSCRHQDRRCLYVNLALAGIKWVE